MFVHYAAQLTLVSIYISFYFIIITKIKGKKTEKKILIEHFPSGNWKLILIWFLALFCFT